MFLNLTDLTFPHEHAICIDRMNDWRKALRAEIRERIV